MFPACLPTRVFVCVCPCVCLIQWGVGYSLGLPLEAIIDNNGHTCEDPDDLDTSAREAYKELRTAAKTLASLTNLQVRTVNTHTHTHTHKRKDTQSYLLHGVPM